MAVIKQCNLQLHEVVGRGGFGLVHRATLRDERDGKSHEVAVKNLFSSTDETELQMLTKLRHPYIIRLLGYVKEPSKTIKGGDDFMLVLEFGSGGSLRSYLDRNDSECPVSVQLLFDWMKQATLPIQFLNERNVQHRDIKSPNYIIAEGMILKLSDFGTAKEVKGTRTTGYVGTRRWAAPEYIKDSHLSTRNDIYPLGLVFWEMMTREIPFHQYSDKMEYQLMQAICEKKERPIIPAFCPQELADLLKRCWEEDRNKRPTLDEILEVIDSVGKSMDGSASKMKPDTVNAATQTIDKYADKQISAQEHSRCFICKSPPTDARALDCLHEFCLECLREWMDSGNGNGAVELMCPNCRKHTHLTSKGVDGLPNYVHLIEDKLKNVHISRLQTAAASSSGINDSFVLLADVVGKCYKEKRSKPTLDEVLSEINLKVQLQSREFEGKIK
ncbi:uncharacterized protein [Amphiura filiformis]|uniref:uncharacterized protein n=1 Tax=Amphiura filiformis TaxID=82378 RepID=UPI003B20C3E4